MVAGSVSGDAHQRILDKANPLQERIQTILQLVRDLIFWGSLLFIAAFQALDFYSLEANYYDSGAFFGLSGLSLVLVAVWLVWTIICIVMASVRWHKRGWLGAVPLAVAVLVFPLNILLGSTTLWQHYNYYAFHQARLDYARRGGGDWGACRSGAGAAGDLPGPALSLDQTRPEIYVTASGSYVLYPIFIGIPDGFSGFLYAPSLDDPIKALPQLNLEFAQLWDREACVFLVGNG
jgi:hypothetical protein